MFYHFHVSFTFHWYVFEKINSYNFWYWAPLLSWIWRNERVVNMSKLTKSCFSCRAQIVVSKYIRGVVRTLFRHSLFNLANCIFANWDKCILLRRIYLVFFFFLIKIIANNYCFVWYNYSYCSQLQKRNDYQFNYQ